MEGLFFMFVNDGVGGIILRVAVWLISACAYGFLTKKVIQNKGYNANGFLWGFFFGLTALIIVLILPVREYETWDEMQKREQEEALGEKLLAKGGWECQCGKVNASYVDTCTCGTTRGEMYRPPQE